MRSLGAMVRGNGEDTVRRTVSDALRRAGVTIRPRRGSPPRRRSGAVRRGHYEGRLPSRTAGNEASVRRNPRAQWPAIASITLSPSSTPSAGQMADHVPTLSIKSIPIDTWGFVDADSPEEKQFVTYLHYWEGLARITSDNYGTQPGRAIKARFEEDGSRVAKKFRALTSKRFSGDEELLRQLLLNSWNSELGLHLVDEDDPRVMPQNQWNNVFAYYASGRAALAWLVARDGAAPQSHRALLDALATQAAAGVSLLLPPWNLCCASHGQLDFHGFLTAPRAVSNLATGADPYDITAKLLKTTREKRITERVKQDHPQRSPKGYKAKVDQSIPPTTVFDFMWRSRTRANYGDPSMFYVGTLNHDRAKRYLLAVRSVNHATMALFELLVAQRARAVLLDAAGHFISRDRTSITDRTVAARLADASLV